MGGSHNPQMGLSFQPLAAPRRIFTPRELMGTLRTAVEREHGDVWVQGEISNFKAAESGHLYFTLKDDAAQLRMVMFRNQARLLRFRPEDGLHVLARGRLTVYEARGELQLSAEYLEPQGAGALQIAFEQLKAKLAAEGLFEAGRKRALPAWPARIGIITSPQGAAVHDLLNILRRRNPGLNVLVYPAQVQGPAAAGEAAAGLKYFNRAGNVEVIIIARGGGSFEDLACFNDEGLARAVLASDIPVISAIGHETDFTIVDFVADLRAPTPSAAAELVTPARLELEKQIAVTRQRLARAARYQLMLLRQRMTALAQQAAPAGIREMLGRRGQRLDEAGFNLRRAMEAQLSRRGRRLDLLQARLTHYDLLRLLAVMRSALGAQSQSLAQTGRALLLRRREPWQRLDARLRELSPLRILERGYAMVFDAGGHLLKDPAQVTEGSAITARLARGSLRAVVKNK